MQTTPTHDEPSVAEDQASWGFYPVHLHMPRSLQMSEDEFLEFCSENSDYRIERTSKGEIVVMPPTGGETAHRNAYITARLLLWAESDGRGRAFDSSCGFELPNGATRSPDASWVSNAKLQPLTREERERFLPLCPDFAIELTSPSDSLRVAREKMREYLENGLRLGWIIDPKRRRVEIFRPDKPTEELDRPQSISDPDVLPGFILDLPTIWEPLS